MMVSAGPGGVCDDITLEKEELVGRWNYVGGMMDQWLA